MAIQKIDTDKCIGCGTCFEGCPCDIIRMDTSGEKARISYPKECQNCHICKNYCPVGAVTTDSSMYILPFVGWA